MEKVTSPLKWAGGKAPLAKHLAPMIAAELDASGGYYIEPFLGGASMALAVRPEKAILADLNAEVINFWQQLRENSYLLIELVQSMGTTKADYYEVRASQPNNPLGRAARFFYLNRTCYNGLWRENKSGGMNTPYGDGKPMYPFDRFVKCAEVLEDLKLVNKSYEEVINSAGPGDVVYADPPYDGGFTAYCARGFTEADQRDLGRCLERAVFRGATVYASNADTELVREIYDWATVEEIDEKRPINSDSGGRGKKKCVLIHGTPS